MEIVVTKTFTKQFLRCPKNVQEDAKNVITSLQKAKTLHDIQAIKKLSGFKLFYRIRIGQYRIGIKEESPKILIVCIMERSQIYKVFPPT
ncbi:MAG: type II toxin-antitoxin system RelE/ParE family toxin [Bacteroidota bacterium]|nr:type II toxin-antitoxin system RelE/ParE family toxin [Bacteroidota bacterium]